MFNYEIIIFSSCFFILIISLVFFYYKIKNCYPIVKKQKCIGKLAIICTLPKGYDKANITSFDNYIILACSDKPPLRINVETGEIQDITCERK